MSDTQSPQGYFAPQQLVNNLREEIASVTKERDDLKAELQKYHLGTVEAHNIIYDLRKERDEANAESEKYRIGWGKCYDQLNEAREALGEAAGAYEVSGHFTYSPRLSIWKQLASGKGAI